MYVKRWLGAPLQKPDGTVVCRDRGTPQGSAISPLLANLFLHYAFDVWLAKNFAYVRFERHADDAVVHCASKAQAEHVLAAIGQRMRDVGLELHPDKTRIVYCKDKRRKGSHEHERFTFLGYLFRPRLATSRLGPFVSFLPAISDEAAKAVRRTIRGWRIHRHSDRSLTDLADFVNPVVRGWIAYYGRFYRSRLLASLERLDDYLARWAMRKYKKLRGAATKAVKWLADVKRRAPTLFAHWAVTAQPTVR